MSSIPPNWTSATLGDVAHEPVEQSGPEADGPFTYIDISSIDKETKRITRPQQLESTAAPSRAKQRLGTNDVLVSMTRPNLNAVARVSEEYDGSIGSTGFCVLRSSFVSPRWLEYRVQAHDFVTEMSGQVQGALYPAVRPKDVFGFRTLLPPKPEQDRIADEIEKQFTRLNDASTALRRVQANLKRYHSSVLEAACKGRLVPTEAELARRDGRDYEPASELLKRILAERRAKWEAHEFQKMIAVGKPPKNDEWKERYSEPEPPDMANLPAPAEGWAVASLEQLTSADRPICYGILMPKENIPDGVLYVRVKDMKNDRIDLSALHRTAPEIAAAYTRASLRTGDLLLAIRGTYGRVAEVPEQLDGGNITQDTARLEISKQLDRDYIAAWLRSTDAQNFFKRVARGVAVKGVNIADVRRTPVLLPPNEEQRRIVNQVDRNMSFIDAVFSATASSLEHASRLRQSALTDAFSGKLLPQDPNDESASVLLERIRAERAANKPEKRIFTRKKAKVAATN